MYACHRDGAVWWIDRIELQTFKEDEILDPTLGCSIQISWPLSLTFKNFLRDIESDYIAWKIALYIERNKGLTVRTMLVPMEIQQPDLALLRGRPWNLCLKFLQMFGFATSPKQMWPRTRCCQFLYRGESPASCFPSLTFGVIAAYSASPDVYICWRPGYSVRVMGASATRRARFPQWAVTKAGPHGTPWGIWEQVRVQMTFNDKNHYVSMATEELLTLLSIAHWFSKLRTKIANQKGTNEN